MALRRCVGTSQKNHYGAKKPLMLGSQTVEAKTTYIPPVLPTQDDLPYDDAGFQNHSIPPLPTQDDLPSCDGVPMETERHRLQMEILINSLKPWLGERGYVSGNMFVYFSAKHLKNKDFRGPDVFVTLGVGSKERKSWVVWEEGKAPDIVIELLSETTTKEDKGKKKQIYQNQLKVAEYYWFDPHNPNDFKGFILDNRVYQELSFQSDCFISHSLGLKLILWRGIYKGVDATWLRWATLHDDLLLLPEEAEAQRAAAEAQRANIAEQRAERLAQRLRELGIDPDKE